MSTHLIFTITLWNKVLYYPHFTEEKGVLKNLPKVMWLGNGWLESEPGHVALTISYAASHHTHASTPRSTPKPWGNSLAGKLQALRFQYLQQLSPKVFPPTARAKNSDLTSWWVPQMFCPWPPSSFLRLGQDTRGGRARILPWYYIPTDSEPRTDGQGNFWMSN